MMGGTDWKIKDFSIADLCLRAAWPKVGYAQKTAQKWRIR